MRPNQALPLLVVMLLLHLMEELSSGFRPRFSLGEMPRRLFWGINGLQYGILGVIA